MLNLIHRRVRSAGVSVLGECNCEVFKHYRPFFVTHGGTFLLYLRAKPPQRYVLRYRPDVFGD